MTKDMQKRRINIAEDVLWKRESGYVDLAKFTGKIQRSYWWKSQFPYVLIKWSLGYHGPSRWEDWNSSAHLYLPRNPTRFHVLHELAHAIRNYEVEGETDHTDEEWDEIGKIPPHGPEFAKLYLELVGRYMGKEAKQELAQAFKENKVKTRKWSPERIEKMRVEQAILNLRSMSKDLEAMKTND